MIRFGARQWVRLLSFNFLATKSALREIFADRCWLPMIRIRSDEVMQRDRKRLRVGPHCDEPAVWPQSCNAVHHRLGRIEKYEDQRCATRLRQGSLPSRTISSAPEIRIILSLSGECEIAICLGRPEPSRMHGRLPKPPHPSTAALRRIGIGPAAARRDGVTGRRRSEDAAQRTCPESRRWSPHYQQ